MTKYKASDIEKNWEKRLAGDTCACGDPSKNYDHHSTYCCCAVRHFKGPEETYDLLVRILAEMETAPDAKTCRHIVKDYLLGER